LKALKQDWLQLKKLSLPLILALLSGCASGGASQDMIIVCIFAMCEVAEQKENEGNTVSEEGGEALQLPTGL
jgi:hypothetical protein